MITLKEIPVYFVYIGDTSLCERLIESTEAIVSQAANVVGNAKRGG